jgi:hypothetical protein
VLPVFRQQPTAALPGWRRWQAAEALVAVLAPQ